MKTFQLINLVLFVIFSLQCNINSCGDNILLGDYLLEETTKNNYFPQTTAPDQLTFIDSMNNELVLNLESDSESGFGFLWENVICWNESWDRQTEYYRYEIIYCEYILEFKIDEIRDKSYRLTCVKKVQSTNDNPPFELFDLVTYDVITAISPIHHGVPNGGTIHFLGHQRNSNMVEENLHELITSGTAEQRFYESISLNGKTYADVYYNIRTFDRPVSIYVTKEEGIIAFEELDGKWWFKK